MPNTEPVGIVLHVLSRCFPTDDVLVIDARRGMSYSSGDVELEHDAEVLLLEELDHYAALWETAYAAPRPFLPCPAAPRGTAKIRAVQRGVQ